MKSVSDMRVFLAKVIAAGQNVESSIIDLQAFSVDGYFSAQINLSGSGVARVQWGVSIDGTNFIYPDVSEDIYPGFDQSSGPGGDGKDIVQFSPTTARFIKFNVTETGTSDPITVTLDIAIQ